MLREWAVGAYSRSIGGSMTSTEIRTKGIDAPGDSKVDGTAAGDNLGLVVGALREIATQLAELNERLERWEAPHGGAVRTQAF